jgi:hypothetical protein
MISYVREAADPEDQNQISFDKLLEILGKFKIQLTESEKKNLLNSFPGRDIGNQKRMNISKLYD